MDTGGHFLRRIISSGSGHQKHENTLLKHLTLKTVKKISIKILTQKIQNQNMKMIFFHSFSLGREGTTAPLICG